MQSGNGVGAAGQPQPQDGHAEVFIVIAGILAAQFHELFLGDTQSVAHGTQMLLHQLGVKAVVAGGHRGVSGENRFARNPADRMIEADALALHAVTNRFQHSESAVAFVQVQNTRA